MNNISEITRRDIYELFCDGYKNPYNFLNENKQICYYYYGRLTEIDFLKKLYPLEQMPSFDGRFENAEDDIRQHTVNNNDYPSNWVFEDERFELLRGSDIILLKFLCAVFHPENRFEKGCWQEYLERINALIRVDGYELYESDEISNRTVYSWRKITSEESVSGRFIPFSLRNNKAIELKTITLPSIPKKIRAEILNLFNRYDKILNRTTETNWNYSINAKEAIIEDMKGYYVPKAFDSLGSYSETKDTEQFIMNNHPYCVFDAIELFEQYNDNTCFANEINLLFKNKGIAYKLLGGKVDVFHVNIQTNAVIKEVGLKELIEQATLLYNSNNHTDKQLAVEKLWDAFERLKTYYPNLDKRKSVEKVVNEMSNANVKYKDLFNEEFSKLTIIGNQFRIRHHETDKIDIIDNKYYDYFFQRCFALIDLVLKYLK